MLHVFEPRGTLQVCATLSFGTNSKDDVDVTLITSDGTGMCNKIIIITVDPRLSEPRLSELSIIRIQKQMKIIGSKFKKLSLHHHL